MSHAPAASHSARFAGASGLPACNRPAARPPADSQRWLLPAGHQMGDQRRARALFQRRAPRMGRAAEINGGLARHGKIQPRAGLRRGRQRCQTFEEYFQTENEAAPTDDVTAHANPKEPDPPHIQDRFRIVRAEKKKATHVVANLKIAYYGKMRQQADSTPTAIDPVLTKWVKV